MENEQIKKEIINFFLEKDILLSPEIFKKINDHNCNMVLEKLRRIDDSNKKILLDEHGIIRLIDHEEEKSKKPENKEKRNSSVKLVFSYDEESKKRDIQDFVAYFNARYKAIENILRNRQELQNIVSINRLENKKDKEEISLIGMVRDKTTTKNNNIILEVEDPTGFVKVLVSKGKKELFTLASNTVLDEVIGIVGMNGDKIVFSNSIIIPDVPLTKELKKSPDEGYAIFLSDLHVGSINFLEKEFNQFLDWINCKTGNDIQKKIAKNTRYIFILGDLIDGLGIYPGQEAELTIKDVKEQYKICADYLRQIPSDIKIIICPGNHDAMRIAEPQLVLYKDFAKPLWDLNNVTMVSNPSVVNIHSSDIFSGFDVLLYHGYSFDYYVANVDSIRNQGGYDRADLIMKFLLQRRHLAPTHTSTLYIPEIKKDPLVIEQVPDFFVTGHIHKSIAANYRNVSLVCGSCWQSKTKFQEKVGHHPEPARVPIVNLQTREIKILRFSKT